MCAYGRCMYWMAKVPKRFIEQQTYFILIMMTRSIGMRLRSDPFLDPVDHTG